MRPEILAPAGGADQLTAAVRCGADAVYLGAGGFNARQNAKNFGDGALAGAVSYAHIRGVKVHVTVNTLVMDAELAKLDGTVREIAQAGADAVIVQDLAVNARFRELCPELPRHASTQMTIHNLDGAKMAADLGAVYVYVRTVYLKLHAGGPQRQPGLVRPALPPGLPRRRTGPRPVLKGYVVPRPPEGVGGRGGGVL